ncbi:hypothetical protein SOQ14_13335 [Erythrobacter sp. T5W1-R]|uniref:hypothetical protein n=1 Tax=Erythrobacter sp. T5W1-R TaxID=3101752 RepID=UPI002AFFD88C|nr:hypothetical protein [Erythrobacter sp. T5W1-R]MEA1619901.1 hypothetical protein [Erythrobacter sp. T5W1-R]
MLYNFARYNAELGLPADIHFLVPATLVETNPEANARLEAELGDISTIHVCPDLNNDPTQISQLLTRALHHPWTSEWLFAQSYTYLLGLLAAQERFGTTFDIIEFPDFGGWAQATIEAKRAGLAFQNTLISARIHSTQGMLYGVERYVNEPGHWAGVMFDAERHLLSHADIIVGHDPEIIDHTARFYGLEGRWEGRTHLEFPPVYLDISPGICKRADQVSIEIDTSACEDFLFGSRLQPVKRPDLFIRAAILIIERNRGWKGTCRLVCNGWDRSYIEGLKALVPERMREQIQFLEQAKQSERLDHINNSIVIVPSEYESLCLFAFEAALGGRKVILNATCPAFGNGYRWHDGENCLLFDGTVGSLADTMEQAVDWKPTSMVNAAPDQPYWLNDLQTLPRPEQTNEGLAGPTMIFCYGAQSSPEFRRQFDVVSLVVQKLRILGEKFEVVFQLPAGAFDQDALECTQVIEQGWALAFSSGLRECPEMFGRRLAALNAQSVVLLPFGYDVSPDFVIAAVKAKRETPTLMAITGHIEVLDGATGRSDYMRVYSGEAPSTALLSSRILPPLCLLDTDVLKRIPFDSWAGECWFEVFARTLALRGEPMLVMPILAAGLDGLMRQRQETSKRVTAGILDQLGIGSGWQSRLLSVDPVQVPSDAAGRPHRFSENQMRQIFRINPTGPVRTWNPVGWDSEEQGVLVHPLNGEVTIGELGGGYRRISKLTAKARNARMENKGAEVAIALARSHIDVGDILAAASGTYVSDAIAISAWTPIEPGGSVDMGIMCYAVSKGNDKILLLSRPKANGPEDNTVVIFSDIELHFNELAIG